MVLVNMSIDDTEVSNAGSEIGAETGTCSAAGFETGTGSGSETGTKTRARTMAGSRIAVGAESPARIGAERSLNDPADAIIDINQPNIPSEGEPKNVMAMLEWAASGLGKLEIGWAMVMLQGGFAFTLQMKDFVFITVTLLFGAIRIFCSNHENNMQQLALFYWFQLISAMTTGVLSAMQLYSQDFGQTEETHKANLDFALNFFYVVALAEALALLAEKVIRKWKERK